MKKILLTFVIMMMMCSVTWAEKQPCTQPGCDDHSGNFTFNDDLGVSGDLAVTGESTLTGSVGINSAPNVLSELYIVSTDIQSIKTETTINDDTLASGWGMGPRVTLTDANGASKNFQGIKNFYTIKNSGNLTGNVTTFNASAIQKLDTGAQTSTWSFVGGYQSTNTVSVAAGDSLTVTKQVGFNSTGIGNLSAGQAGAVYNITSFEHFSIEDSLNSDQYDSFPLQTGFQIDEMDSADVNIGINLAGGQNGIAFEGPTGTYIRGDDNIISISDESSIHATESLTAGGDFSGGVIWTGGNGWTLDATNASYAHDAAAGDLTQPEAQLNRTGSENSMYKFTYTVSNLVSDGFGMTINITTGFANETVRLPLRDGTYSVAFLSAVNPADFVISVESSGAGDSFDLDDFSLKEVIAGSLVVQDSVYIRGDGTGCLMMRDTDDAGWTECFVLDGTMSCTIDADGICDGA